MPQVKKLLELSTLQYYIKHLALLNCILPVQMTPKEMEIMANFMSLEGDLALNRFGLLARKLVMKNLELSPSGLHNHLDSLLDKKFLVKRGDIIEFQPILFPEPDEQIYTIKLKKISIDTSNESNEEVTNIKETA